jgi:hypothetical protein
MGMGGAILEKHFGVVAKRIKRETYNDIQRRILDILAPKVKAAMIAPQIGEKLDFGDLDVLVHVDPKMVDSIVQETFGMKPHRVALTYSFPFEGVQIDLTAFDSAESLNFAFNYYSWNDLNTICSAIYKKRGLKYGVKGLYFRGDNSLISRNPAVIRFLGGWEPHNGFATYEQAFQWVATSPHFDPCLWLDYETRDRVMRVKWLAWLKENFG